MKKILALFMSALLFLSVAACGNTGTEKTGITSPDDLDGKKVAVQMATTADDYLTELVESGRDIEILRYEKVTQCFDDLKFKRVDAVLVDRVVASYYMDDNSTSEIVWKNDEGEPMAICLKKRNDKLTEAVEKAIDTLYYNGKIGELAAARENEGHRVGIIATQETMGRYDHENVKCIGTREDESTVAANLYAILREFDDDGTEYIYSEAFASDGIGSAVMNRLLKAAGHHVINV